MTIMNSHQFQAVIRLNLADLISSIEKKFTLNDYETEANYPNYFYLILRFRDGDTVVRLHITIFRNLNVNNYTIVTTAYKGGDNFTNQEMHVPEDVLVKTCRSLVSEITALPGRQRLT